MNGEKEILSKLVIEEGKLDKEELERLVSFLKDYVFIEDKTGKVGLKNPNKLSNANKITLYLSGVYCAFRLDLRDKNEASLLELTNTLNIKRTTLSAPLKRLVDSRAIRRTSGKYNMTAYEIYNLIRSDEK